MSNENIKKVVLAYSGGLDTSIIIPWLKENYNNCEIIAVAGNVGQADELEGLEEKAIKTGASKLIVADMVDEMVDDIYHRFVGYEDIIEAAFAAIKKTMNTAENVHIHMSGAKNILTFPEFSDVEKAKTLFQTLEEKERIAELLSVGGNEIDVMIGGEISIEEMQDCSLITATYDLGNNNKGKIGILGPTRMDYPQVVSILNSMVRNIETAMQKSIGVKKNGS